MTSLMNTGRQGAKQFILLLLTALAGIGYAALASAVPVDVSGSIGYNFRSLKDQQGSQTDDNQLLGTLNLSSYIWRPWLATAQLGLTATLDNSNYDNNASRANTSIFTGELHLNVLPQSRTPLQLTYNESDSRVENFTIQSPLVTFKDEFKTRELQLIQSYITEGGHRFQFLYDRERYDSHNTGNFEDDKYGLEGDVHLPRQHILGNVNYETYRQISDASPQQVDSRKSNKLYFDLTHFWYPTSNLRVDSLFSYYNTDENVDLPPLSSNQLTDSTTDLGQLSSTFFWRPEQRPITLSGGVRIYDLQTKAADTLNSQITSTQTTSSPTDLSNSLKNFSISATGGGIYQYTKNLRFDGNVAMTSAKSDTTAGGSDTIYSSQERGGALWQSDIIPLKGFNYQWYTNVDASNETSDGQSVQRTVWTLAHDAQRGWSTSPDSMLSVSLSQALSEDYQSVVQETHNFSHNLTDSGFVTWNQSAWNGTTTLRLTLSDIRDLGNPDQQQQLANFQATRTQEINRRSTLTGDLTIQNVHQSFQGQTGESSVTTSTGRINFTYRELFGLPELQFLSDLYVSQASRDATFDRREWENRVNYSIGQLFASASYRLIQINNDTFDLLYVQVSRRF